MRTTMQAMDLPMAPAMPVAAPLRGARLVDELDDFRRFNFAEGWDRDDAELGWVGEEIVRGGTRRLH